MKYCEVISKRVVKAILLLLLSFTSPADTFAEQDLEKCHTYSSYPSSYSGRLLLKQYPAKGETLKKGETPHDYWVLELPKSICTTDFPDYSLDKTEFNVKNIHLYMKNSQFNEYKKFLYSTVVVKAGIFRAHSTDDRTRVVMSVSTMELKMGREKCFGYKPKVVTIRGNLYKKTFPGPPNYESIADGDRAETQWLLSLEEEICVEKKPSGELDLNDTEYNISRVTLGLSNKDWKKVTQHLLANKIEVSGTLMHAHTAHHRTKILINVKKMRGIE